MCVVAYRCVAVWLLCSAEYYWFNSTKLYMQNEWAKEQNWDSAGQPTYSSALSNIQNMDALSDGWKSGDEAANNLDLSTNLELARQPLSSQDTRSPPVDSTFHSLSLDLRRSGGDS